LLLTKVHIPKKDRETEALLTKKLEVCRLVGELVGWRKAGTIGASHKYNL